MYALLRSDRVCFKENSSLHISSVNAGVYAKFLNELPSFTQKFLFIQPNFPMIFFYYCTNNPSSLHISSHHCTFCASLHVKTGPAISGWTGLLNLKLSALVR